MPFLPCRTGITIFHPPGQDLLTRHLHNRKSFSNLFFKIITRTISKHSCKQMPGNRQPLISSIMKIIIPILLLNTLLLCGCNSTSCGWDDDVENVSKPPAAKEMYGSYKPDDRTRKKIPGYTNSTAEIILQEADNVQVKNVPVSTFDFVDYYKGNHQTINGGGKWKPDYGQFARISVGLSFDDNKNRTVGTFYRLYKKDGKYVIILPIAHPDACIAARFIQQ